MSVDVMERMRAAFRSEALELLTELDSALLALEADPENGSLVHRVFRAIHTIKGSGATAGFRHLAAVAHKLEELFDLARSGLMAVSAALIDCGLKTCDVLRAILSAEDPEAERPEEREVSRALAELVPRQKVQTEESTTVCSTAPAAGRCAYEIVVRPHRDLFYSGTDPMTLLDELRGIGQAHITAQTDAVPLFSELEPESCYLRWNVRLVTDRGAAAVREIFAFVEDQCDVSIRLLDDQRSAVALFGTIPAESLGLFTVECQDHLAAMESHALALESGVGCSESLDALFRAVHSIKGNAGLLLGQLPGIPEHHPLPTLARLAHAIESALDACRHEGGASVPPKTIAMVLEARDAMEGLLAGATGSGEAYVVPAHLLEALGISTKPLEGSQSPADSAFHNTASQCLEVLGNCLRQLDAGETDAGILKAYQRSLKTLGSAAAYQNRSDLGEPVASQLRILDAAMQDGSGLSGADRKRLAESLRATRLKIEGSTEVQPEPGTASKGVASLSAPAAQSSTIRIDQEKLDRLMRVVGELLVAKGAFPDLIQKLSTGEDRVVITRILKDAGANISHIAEELQASVMAIRMLPVKNAFQRFPRLVRDMAHSMGKEVQLVVEGETVELDKTILEQIGDPLVHLVRNALDHGLERPEERRSAGKATSGRLSLRASNDAGHVCIEVEDDGRGLNADALKRKAIEKGLVSPEAAAAMSYADACRLVFLPGLSTAAKVTEVSGRGVGMDVVRNNIRDLQGTVDIRSKPGVGTAFSIKLPTSLIVSKGILLEAGGQEYILPLGTIRDMVKIPAAAVRNCGGHLITQVRGQIYPLVRLADMFGLDRKCTEEISVAVIESGKVRYGLVADRFASEVEVLVKPLAGALANCREFHGAAILGDGRVVLVLNPLECHRGEVI